MKHRVFMVFGEEHCKIVNDNDTVHFNQIRDEIRIYEFQSMEEIEAFKKGVDEATGFDQYQILTEHEVEEIMETI